MPYLPATFFLHSKVWTGNITEHNPFNFTSKNRPSEETWLYATVNQQSKYMSGC